MSFNPIRRFQSWLVPEAPRTNLIGITPSAAARQKHAARNAATRDMQLPPRVTSPTSSCPGPIAPRASSPATATAPGSRPNPARATATQNTAASTIHSRSDSFSHIKNAADSVSGAATQSSSPIAEKDDMSDEWPEPSMPISTEGEINDEKLRIQQVRNNILMFDGLSQFIKSKSGEIRDTRLLPKGQQKKAIQCLNSILKEIEAVTEDGIFSDDENNDGRSEAAYQSCKKISKICESALKINLDDKGFHKMFDQLRRITGAMKRHHNTRSGKYKLTKYATINEQNLGLICSGLVRKRPGSEISAANEVGGGISTSIIPAVLTAGPMAKFRQWVVRSFKIDDDGDILKLLSKFVSIEVGVQAKFLNVPNPKNWDRHLLSFSAKAKATKERGNYADYKTTKDALRAVARSLSNSWSFVYRSGSEKSFGGRLVALMHLPREACCKIAAGNLYQYPGPMPNVSTEKLNKGGGNQDGIVALGKELFGSLSLTTREGEKTTLVKLMEECYSSSASELRKMRIDHESPDTTPDMPDNSLSNFSPKQTPGGRYKDNYKSIERDILTIELEASLNGPRPEGQHGGQLHFGANAKMAAEKIRNKTLFMKFYPPHHQIDPDYSADAEASHTLLNDFEQKYRGHPQSHLFCTFKQKLYQGKSRAESLVEIDTITRIDRANNATNEIHDLYVELVELSGKLRTITSSTKSSCPYDRDQVEDFESSFKTFCNTVFGIQNSPTTRKAFLEKLRNDPDYFMTKGYDAISMAFSHVGLHIHDTKMHGELDAGSQLRTNILNRTREKLENNYRYVTKALNAFLLPTDEVEALRKISIIPPSESVNDTLSITADLTAGAYCSSLAYINGNAGDPQGPKSGPGSPNSVLGRFANSAVIAAGAGLHLLHRKHDKHPNPVRSGYFDQLKVSINGEGFMGSLLAGALDVASLLSNKAKQRFRFTDDASTQDDKSAWKRFTSSALTSLAMSPVSMPEHEKEVSVSSRRPLPVGHFVYEKKPQWLRVVSRKSNTISASVGVPLQAAGAFVSVSASYRHTETASNVAFESMGTDLGYHLIQSEALEKVLDRCKHETNGADQKKGDINFRKLKGFFSPVASKRETQLQTDTTYMCGKYFGSDDTVLGLMEDFMYYAENPRSWTGSPREGISRRNEFHRFDDDPTMWRTIKSMVSSRAGSGLARTHGQTSEELVSARGGTAKNLDPRPRFDPETMEMLKGAIARMKTTLAEKSHTAEERRDLFLNNSDPKSDGCMVLGAYFKVLSGYNEINTQVKATTTYKSEIQPPDPLPT